MIRISNLIHRGLVNINTNEALSVESSELNNMTVGNKIALLCGDYLLSNSCAELASLRNQDVSMYIYYFSCLYINFVEVYSLEQKEKRKSLVYFSIFSII